MGRGGGSGSREWGQEPAEEQSARSARRRLLGEKWGREEERTDGPAGRTNSLRGPAQPLTSSLLAALPAAASSRCPQGPAGPSGRVSAPAPSAQSRLGGGGRLPPLPASGGGTVLAPWVLPRPLQPSLPARSAHTRGADPGSCPRRSQRRASGRRGPRCPAEWELEVPGGGL